MKIINIGGYPILVFEKDGKEYYWLAGCPHKQRPLTNAEIKDDLIICPFHKAVFNLITGELVSPPQSKTPCPENCKLIKAIIKDGNVEFDSTPFLPKMPEK